jgi:hypothetical protein
MLYTRYVDPNNYYYLLLNSAAAVIKRKVGGVTTQLATAPFPTVLGTEYAVRFEASGSNLRGYVNGVLVVSAVDSALTSGIPALAGSNADVTFDNIEVSLNDDFQNGNAAGWTTSGGTWTVTSSSGNYSYNQTNVAAGQFSATRGFTTWTDYGVEARMKVNAFGSSGSGMLFARYTNSSNYYYALLNGTDLVLKKKAGGVASVIATVPLAVSTGTWYTVELLASGADIEVWVGGIRRIRAKDSSLTTGAAGLAGHNVDLSFDDVVIK